MSTVVDSLPRPARLNFAGFCWYCGERGCENPGCVQMHAKSHWGLCPDCQGAENIGHEWKPTCNLCYGGLVEHGPAEAGWVVAQDGFVR